MYREIAQEINKDWRNAIVERNNSRKVIICSVMLPIVELTYVNIYPLFNDEIIRAIENREAYAVIDTSCKR